MMSSFGKWIFDRVCAGFVVNVRVSMSDPAMAVRMPMDLPAPDDLPQGVDPQNYQHQRHAKFQHLRQAFADLKMQQDDQDSGDKQRDSMADAPKPSDQRSAPETFALAHDGRNRRQVVRLG